MPSARGNASAAASGRFAGKADRHHHPTDAPNRLRSGALKSTSAPGRPRFAIVTPGDLPNSVRKVPVKSDPNNIIYTLYPGEIVKILAGPICSDDLVFWKVENGDIPGGSGWR